MNWKGIAIFFMVVIVVYKNHEKNREKNREREIEFNNKLREMNKGTGFQPLTKEQQEIADKYVWLSNGDSVLKTEKKSIPPNKK